jgi:hypothetical protein
MKKTFVGYCDWKSYVDEMSDEQSWLLFKTIINYSNNLEIGQLDQLTKVVFSKIKKTMDDDDVKYKEICEKRKKAIQERYNKYKWKEKDTNVYKWIQKDTNVYKTSDVYYDTDTDTDTDTDYSSKWSIKEREAGIYDEKVMGMVKKFTSIKENAYNETKAVIKKITLEKYLDNQYKSVTKLIKQWHSFEEIESVAIFCTKDGFWQKQVKSLCKLDQSNKDWVKYINVLLDKIK